MKATLFLNNWAEHGMTAQPGPKPWPSTEDAHLLMKLLDGEVMNLTSVHGSCQGRPAYYLACFCLQGERFATVPLMRLACPADAADPDDMGYEPLWDG